MADIGDRVLRTACAEAARFTRIKIDKSFIQDLGKTQESLAIVRAVTSLCSSLGVATTAEGDETAEQMRILLAEGCQELQGYLLGRPTGTPECHGEQVNCHPADTPPATLAPQTLTLLTPEAITGAPPPESAATTAA